MEFYQYFNIDTTKKEVISVVGGGGKTTTIFNLAESLKKSGKKVLVTTTTKIYWPNQSYIDEILLMEKNLNVNTKNAKGLITVLGKNIIAENKIKGLEPEVLKDFIKREDFDYVLTEADGAKKRSIKAPDKHEPVIISDTTKVIGVIGLDCYGKQINDVNVHRWQVFAELTNSNRNQEIDEKILKKLVTHKQGLFKNAPKGSEKILLLNKLDKINDKSKLEILLKEIQQISNLQILVGNVKNQKLFQVKERDK